MNVYSLITALILFGLAIWHFANCYRLIRHTRKGKTEPLSRDECPKALVVLCLRGIDPFVKKTLHSLITQDYPNYLVRIVLDSVTDSSRKILEEVWGSTPPDHVELLELREIYPTCTYKMSALLTGFREIPNDIEIVALLDGDVIPHKTWLRELAAPIVRRGVGVSTGQRWFFPDNPTLGSMGRFWWNAYAMTRMVHYQHPWGGTMAATRAIIEDERLHERLRHALAEDTTIGHFSADHGYGVYFEPTLYMINREDISVRDFMEFELRQVLMCKKGFHGYRGMILLGAVSIPMLVYPLLRLAGIPFHLVTDIAFVTFMAAFWFGIVGIGMAIRKILVQRGDSMGTWDARRWIVSTAAAFCLALIHLRTIVRLQYLKRFRWRGVWYRLEPGTGLQVEQDEWATGTPTADPEVNQCSSVC